MSDPAELIKRLQVVRAFLNPNNDAPEWQFARDHVATLDDVIQQLAGPAPMPSVDPAQDGYYNQQKCSRCGVLAIDFAVVCAFCQGTEAGPAREPHSSHVLTADGRHCERCHVATAEQAIQIRCLYAPAGEACALTDAQILEGIDAVVRLQNSCAICGDDGTTDEHASQPHGFEPVDLVDAFRDAIGAPLPSPAPEPQG